jgi:cytochrome P450
MTVDTSHQTYSSDAAFGGITLKDVPLQYRKESFIAMDPPRHDEQRKIVAPIVAPPNLAKMSGTIRERAIRILEGLPRGEVFDWVDRERAFRLVGMVSITQADSPRGAHQLRALAVARVADPVDRTGPRVPARLVRASRLKGSWLSSS